MNEPIVMKMLYAIREKHYDETKDLSPKELVEKIRHDAEEEMKRVSQNKYLQVTLSQ